MHSASGASSGDHAGKASYRNCAALHFDCDPQSRDHVTTALKGMGFGRIEQPDSYETLCEAVDKGRFDLMVSETGRNQDDICQLVRNIRHNAVGHDPFPAIIMVTARPESGLVRRAIDSGPDHLLRWPFADDQISRRVDAIVEARKPFVVTFNYIGPDRRSDPARANGTALFEVPNALRAKAKRDVTAMPTPEAIEAAVARINLHRIGCCHATIATAIERLKTSHRSGQRHAERTRELAILLTTVRDLKQRVAGTDHADSDQLCAALTTVVEKIRKAGDSATDTDFELLEQTGMALQLSFRRSRRGGASADVSSTTALITGKRG